jgi:hypothetical protein
MLLGDGGPLTMLRNPRPFNRCRRSSMRNRLIKMSRLIVLPAILVALMLRNERAARAETSQPLNIFDSCRTIPNDTARLRCFEDATSNFSQPPVSPKTADGWRTVRTPGPKPGADVISKMRTADLLRSDPAFAGLALHCGESGPEIVVIVVEPFPPRSRPRVEIGQQASDGAFEASVLPGGAALLLPAAATALANGAWQSQPELSVKIENAGSTIQGVVPLSGLKEALNAINISCSSGRQ